jgi:hypothetical protein
MWRKIRKTEIDINSKVKTKKTFEENERYRIEAMASHRPYRPALGIDKAIEEISQKKGTLYDPEVVDACLRLFTVKGFNIEC